jgi:hypothetical protein
MTPSKETKLWHIDAAIEVKKLYISYWTDMVKTGAYKGRQVLKGNYKLSDQKLIEDCMNTVLNHIYGIQELIDERLKLMNGE